MPCSCPLRDVALPPLRVALPAPGTRDGTEAQAGLHRLPLDVAFTVAVLPPGPAEPQAPSQPGGRHRQGGSPRTSRAARSAVGMGGRGPGRDSEVPSYPKADLPMGTHLQVEPVGAIPVAVDDIHFAIAVEVGQGDTSPVLVGVVHTWGGTTGTLKAAPPAGPKNARLA